MGIMEISSGEIRHLTMANNGDMKSADWEQKSIIGRTENFKILNLQILRTKKNRNTLEDEEDERESLNLSDSEANAVGHHLVYQHKQDVSGVPTRGS